MNNSFISFLPFFFVLPPQKKMEALLEVLTTELENKLDFKYELELWKKRKEYHEKKQQEMMEEQSKFLASPYIDIHLFLQQKFKEKYLIGPVYQYLGRCELTSIVFPDIIFIQVIYNETGSKYFCQFYYCGYIEIEQEYQLDNGYETKKVPVYQRRFCRNIDKLPHKRYYGRGFANECTLFNRKKVLPVGKDDDSEKEEKKQKEEKERKMLLLIPPKMFLSGDGMFCHFESLCDKRIEQQNIRIIHDDEWNNYQHHDLIFVKDGNY